MKKRISKVLNFFAFNLLFFALYLNFIHKDSNPPLGEVHNAAPAMKGTVLVENPEQYLQKYHSNNVAANNGTDAAQKTAPLKLSFN
ncbi:MAG TPA: hypothetical protein VM843_04215 [Flavisolibacter sp.]|nr:hypothetical protein [Flavisolibacter sp.]